MTRSVSLRTFSRLAAVAALLLVSGCKESTREQSNRASNGRDHPLRAVAAYNAPAYGREIQLVQANGTRVRIDPHPPLPIDGSWSPDGTRIAFSGGEGVPPVVVGARNLYTAAGDGSDVRLVYRGPASSPSWSPDGNWIAFSGDEGRGAWIVRADGHRARRVADLVVDTSAWVEWSPDGRELAIPGQDLSHGSTDDAAVYTVRRDGSRLRRLTRPLTPAEKEDEAGIFDVQWAPDGGRIAFVRYADSAPTDEVDVVDANGQNERRIGGGDCPAWSPDGERLAYSNGRIVVVRADRSGRLIAARNAAGCPIWFADGRHILFFAEGAYVVDAVSGSVRKATAAERNRVRLFQDAREAFTTDGRFLDSEGDFDENHYVVHVSTLRGTVATFRWSDDSSPAWSPDRRKLMFVRLQTTEQIFIFDTISRRLHRFAVGTNPAWSPDGKWIAFEHKNDVFVGRVRGGTARKIGKGRFPAWSPDGRFIAATGGGAFVMSPDGARRRRIDLRAVESCDGGAEPPTGRPTWSHDGRRLTFSYWCEADQMYVKAAIASDAWRP